MEQETVIPKQPKKKIKMMTAEERRAYNAQHKRKSRKKQKLKEAEIEAQLQKNSIFNNRGRRGLTFFGEMVPGKQATGPELIRTLREWLRALEQPDIKKGESLYDLAKRCWEAWTYKAWCPEDPEHPTWVEVKAFDSRHQRFDDTEGFGLNPSFDYWWTPSAEELVPIVHSKMLPLPYREVFFTEKPKPAQPIPFERQGLRSNTPTVIETIEHAEMGELYKSPTAPLDPLALRYLQGG